MSDQAPEADGDVLARLGMDGHLWAKEFQITAVRLGYQPMDEGWLIGWFCNAIMAGYDTAENRARLDTVYTRAQVEAMLAEALGDAVRFVVGIEPGNRRWIRRDAVLAHLAAAIRAQGEADK